MAPDTQELPPFMGATRSRSHASLQGRAGVFLLPVNSLCVPRYIPFLVQAVIPPLGKEPSRKGLLSGLISQNHEESHHSEILMAEEGAVLTRNLKGECIWRNFLGLSWGRREGSWEPLCQSPHDPEPDVHHPPAPTPSSCCLGHPPGLRGPAAASDRCQC